MINISQNNDQLINYKVYLAGQYAPSSGVTTQQGIFTFSEAQIELFSHKIMDDFGEDDRVPCQIFFLDKFNNPNAPEYKLMFDGEVISHTYTRTPGYVGMSLAAVSHFEILAQMFKSLFDNIVDKSNQQINATDKSNASFTITSLLGNEIMSNIADSGVKYSSTFSDIFSRESLETRTKNSTKDDRFMRRPIVLFRNILLDLINGLNHQDLSRDIDLFFKSFVSKRNIIRSIISSPILEEGQISIDKSDITANIILNAVRDEDTIDSVTEGISLLAREFGNNSTFSYWDVLIRTFSTIMYEAIFPLCPPYLVHDIFGTPNTTNQDNITKYKSIMNVLTKPSITYGVPPLFNTIFPCMIQQISKNNQHFTAPTRFYLQNPTTMNKYVSDSGDYINQLNNYYSSAIWPQELAYEIIDGKKVLRPPNEVKGSMIWTTKGPYNEFFKGPVLQNVVQAPSWMNFVSNRTIPKVIAKGSLKNTSEEKKQSTADIVDNYNSIRELYAQNQFEKERASRKAITLNLHFNPYLMPGFPVAIIDNIQYGIYYLAIPVSIVHNLSTNAASTTIQVTNVIKFKDAYGRLKPEGYSVGPLNPSSQVSDIFNKYQPAEEYYSRTFYQSKPMLRYVFRPEDYFTMGPDGDINSTIDSTFDGILPGVIDEASKFIMNLDDALTLVSRPIASLSDYIEFNTDKWYTDSEGNFKTINSTGGVPHGGTKAIQTPKFFNGLNLSKEVVNKSLKLDSDPNKDLPRGLPIYYEKILGYTYLGQTVGGVEIFPNPPTVDGEEPTSNKPTDVHNYPDFILDWAERVSQYRIDILNNMNDFYIG